MSGAIEIQSRRELFVDDFLIDALAGGAQRRLHQPTPREMVLFPDKPWETRPGYTTVFYDKDRYRMYYKASQMSELAETEDQCIGRDDCTVCYAESDDGIHWTKPSLGLFEFAGSTDNNIVWMGKGSHGFAPFRDTRPDCPPEARYKAFGRSKLVREDLPEDRFRRSLFAFTSPDGVHWTIAEGPKEFGAIFDRYDGYFDSQNVGFWHEREGCYRVYLRKKREAPELLSMTNRDDGDGGVDTVPMVRDICTATSEDFIHWTKPEFLDYPGAPAEELYTNAITAYPRAPHIMVGFPARYMENRGFLTEQHEARAEQRPGRYFQSYTDGLFMSSRDGQTFHRFGEAFLRPGMPEDHRWGYGECYMNWGIVETAAVEVPGAPNELSFYICEGGRLSVGKPEEVRAGMRRHTLRLDGFASINAPFAGGELLTKPLRFEGERLLLNMATSAAGDIAVELQDAQGEPLRGFTLDDCVPQFGNSIEREMQWAGDRSLGELAGETVRLRFVMRDADLFALRFA